MEPGFSALRKEREGRGTHCLLGHHGEIKSLGQSPSAKSAAPPKIEVVVGWLERVDLGKMNLELEANEENQDRAQYGNNQAGGMIAFV